MLYLVKMEQCVNPNVSPLTVMMSTSSGVLSDSATYCVSDMEREMDMEKKSWTQVGFEPTTFGTLGLSSTN